MTTRRMLPVLALACCVIGHASQASEPDTAAARFAQGAAALQKGDFHAALADYAAAARAEPANEHYRQQHALLRRIMQMRDQLEQETDSEKWEAGALALRSFYQDNGVHGELLALDRRAHARLNSADSAARLADTLLARGDNNATVDLLSALDESRQTDRTRVLLGIALARTGRLEEAKVIAGKVIPADDGPGMLYDVARLRALVGNTDGAMAALTACFEQTRPSRLAAFKDLAKADADLAGIARHDGFAKVLATASKIKESSCSGGESCAKCPSRGKCPGQTTSAGKK